MTITPDNYLNIFGIIVNELFGSIILFILIGLAILIYVCMTNDVNLNTTVALGGAFVLITLTAYYNALILAIIILIFAIVIYTRYNYHMRQQNS